MTADQLIESTWVDSIAVVTINRPEKRNALTMAAVETLTAAIEAAGSQPRTRGLVLTGRGAFCAGADLKSVVDGAARDQQDLHAEIEAVPQRLIHALVHLPVPTVAAINGPAIGMGMDIALACDSRLVGPDGWLMQGWGRIGLIAGTGGVLMLRGLNPSALWQLLEKQEPINGEAAADLGIAEAVNGDATAAAVIRLQAIAGMPRAAVDAYLALQREALIRELEDHLRECSRLQAGLLAREDFSNSAQRYVPDVQTHLS